MTFNQGIAIIFDSDTGFLQFIKANKFKLLAFLTLSTVNQRAIFASDQHESLSIVLMLGKIVCGSLTISKC